MEGKSNVAINDVNYDDMMEMHKELVRYMRITSDSSTENGSIVMRVTEFTDDYTEHIHRTFIDTMVNGTCIQVIELHDGVVKYIDRLQ